MIQETKLKGNLINLNGVIPSVGDKARNFHYVRQDLSEGSLEDHGRKAKIIIAVPSLDTGICQIETKRFSQLLSQRPEVVGIVISKDLPFAMKRFCAAEGITNMEVASDFRGNFSADYHTLMNDGPMKGLSARVVFVLDEHNVIRYVEVVDDITHEPDYDAALAAVDALTYVEK